MDLDLLTNPFYQRALAAAGFIGFTNGFFSGFVVLRRNALSVSALSHTMLPGIALAIFVTGALSLIELWDAQRWHDIDSEAERSLTSARPGLDDIGI